MIGERHNLPRDIAGLLDEAETTTQANSGLLLVVAFNYAVAMRSLGRPAPLPPRWRPAGLPRTRSTRRCSNHASTRRHPRSGSHHPHQRRGAPVQLPDVAGAYAEFVFVDTHWPDFKPADFDAALDTYMSRERRFGA